jgi:hypothetical protein
MTYCSTLTDEPCVEGLLHEMATSHLGIKVERYTGLNEPSKKAK